MSLHEVPEVSAALTAFEQWITEHTLENRTLKEMFLAGYLTARDGRLREDTR